MKKIIATDSAPAALGPYSQAVEANGIVFCSGQIPVNPQSGEIVSGDIKAATRQVINNLSAVLESAGLGLGDIVKTTVFLADMNDFATVNEAYAEFFTETPPARACVEVAKLPKGVDIEIEAIAVRT